MNIKPQPNRKQYIEALRKMTPEQRVMKAFELSEMTRKLFRAGLKQAFPHLAENEFEELYRKRLDKCRNRNW
jgi:hypothetical protein